MKPTVKPARATSPTTGKRKEREFDARATKRDEQDVGSTNINVVVRCRGRSEREVKENSGVVLSTDGVKGQNVELSMGPSALSNKTYRFDKVFSPAADQSMIYDEVVTPMLNEMLAGYNCTIFAYGQTGTGKTYTMSGDMSDTLGLISDSAGIIPRVLNSLFRVLESEGDSSVKCSFIELYNEELRDLLSLDDGVKLKIYDGHNATLVQGMEETYIKSAPEGIKLLQCGSQKRQVAATKCNDLSSRSHTVFTVTTYIKRVTEGGEDYVSAGKLNLVDLAGSENIQRSGAENKRAAEAGVINKSLLTLGRVINALVERGSHIPYRESKLTRLLQDSLGGRTKTCIIATVSPAKSNLEETISTLDYAFRAKNIKNKPQINSLISKKTLFKDFAAEIEKLKGELIATRHRNGVYLTAESYDEIMVQSESRRILSEEQKERIETIEVSLRNKVQELFNLTNSFTCMKKDVETARQTLEETKGILERTEFVLCGTRQSLEEERVLRQAHQSTEGALTEMGKQLLSTLGQTVLHVNGLHLKIDREDDLQKRNMTAWQTSQSRVADSSTMLQQKIDQLQHEQQCLTSELSSRIAGFVKKELETVESSKQSLESQVSNLEQSHENAILQSNAAKEEMHLVLEEIKVLREEVKQRIGEGLNGLSTAAGRISAEIVQELGLFQTKLHNSYSSLGKDFKNVFDDVMQHLQVQKVEAETIQARMTASIKAAAESESKVTARIRTCLQEERQRASRERQTLLQQITNLVNKNAEDQERRWTERVGDLEQDLNDNQSNLASTNAEYGERMHKWSQTGQTFAEEVSSSRDALKSKMKDDWKAVNEQNSSIQQTTRSIQEETIRIVDAQMENMAKQMQALDEFVSSARMKNEQHHEGRIFTLNEMTSNVQTSYSEIRRGLASTENSVGEFGSEASTQVDTIQATPFSSIKQHIGQMTADMCETILEEYIPTGSTPQRQQYIYSTNLPRTEVASISGVSPGKTLRSPGKISPSKFASPSKTPIFNDMPSAPSFDIPPVSKVGLREISLNVGSAHRQETEMGPPLKRQATESKLPTKGGGRSVVRLEGRENLGAGRRLRSSPGEL